MDTSCLVTTGASSSFPIGIAVALVVIAFFVVFGRRFRLGHFGLVILLVFSLSIDIVASVSAQNRCPSPPDISSPNPRPAPNAPKLDAPTSGSLLNYNTPVFSGSGQEGATVVVKDQNKNILCQALVSNNVWSCTSKQLSDGNYNVVATQTSAQGVVSPESNPLAFTIDTTEPAVPIIQFPTPNLYTNNNLPTITGTAEPSTTVHVFIDSGTAVSVVADSTGAWALTPNDPFADGWHNVYVSQTDVAGNSGPDSQVVSFYVDTTPINVTVNQSATQPDPTGTNSILFTVVFSETPADQSFTPTDVSIMTSPTTNSVYIASFNQLDNTTWEVEVQGMPNNTTVTATISANSVQDIAGNNNTASTSTDNSVLYQVLAPFVLPMITNNPRPTLTGECQAGHSLEISLTGVANHLFPATCDQNGQWTLAVDQDLAEGDYDMYVSDITAGETGSLSALTVDFTQPGATVNQKYNQADPTKDNSAVFTIVFSEVIDATSFAPEDLALSGTSTGSVTTFTQIDNALWEVVVTGMTSGDTVSVSIPAGALKDRAGNENNPSTSTDNSVTYDSTQPTVTVNQSAGQDDPTEVDSASFTIVFSEPIVSSSFTAGDLTVAGTTGTVTNFAQIDATTWEAVVTGMTLGNTAILSLGADKVQDAAGNTNQASTSTDNSVTFQLPTPQTFCDQQTTWTCVHTEGNTTYGQKTFEVPARQHFVNTGLYLNTGETATITESGTWTVNGNDGNTYNHCNYGDLIARINLVYSNTDYTCVNGTVTFTAPRSGILFVGGLSGSDLGDFYGGRYPASGSKTVTITSNGLTVPTLPASDAATYNFGNVASGMVEIWGEHVILTVPTSIAQQDAATIQNATKRLDDIYKQHAVIQARLPYHGEPIRFIEDSQAPGYMLAGNPIRTEASIISGTDPNERITRAGEPNAYNWGFAHELGHDFTVPGTHWIYMYDSLESWPNIFSCHAFEVLSLHDAHWSNVCATPVAGNNQYNTDWNAGTGLQFLLHFKHQYGWDFYRQVFEQINTNESVPFVTSWNVSAWRYNHDIFENVAGEDITPVFDAWGVPRP